MKMLMKRWLAMMLAVMLVVTGIPIEAFASTDGEDEQVENVEDAGTFDGSDEEKEWLVDESLISEYSEISFVPSNYTAQLVIAGDEYFDWSSSNWRILYTTDSELGQDFFPNVVSVSADEINTEDYGMTSCWEAWDAEWNDSNGRYEARGYFKGEDSAFLPNTDYYCRVVYQKWNSTVGAYEYYFLTEPIKMTTLAAVVKTAVSNVTITVENGYSDSLISWHSYNNPNNEYIAQSGFVLKYGDGTEEFVSADCQWYETYYLETTGDSVPVEVYGQIMVYTGNAEETYIRTKSCAIESLNFEDATVEVATGAIGVNGFIVDVEVTPYTVDEDLLVSIFWRKKGEETWTENKKALYSYELYDESTLWTVSNLDEATEYEYYVQIKADYSSDIVYWSSEDEPITVCTKENVTYTDEQFPDDVFRNYIKEQLGLSEDEAITADKAETITEILIAIDSIEAPIKSIEGIQYLKCLKRLTINAHDITDISMLGDMTELEEISLSANDIVEFPDLSKLNKLYLLILENNCIDADTFAMSKYPKGEYLWSHGKTKISSDLSNQRGETRYNLPSGFYMAGDKSPFVIELKNFKSLYRQYTLTVDTGEKVVTGSGRAGDVFYIEDMGLSVGDYTARVTIEDQFGVAVLDIPEVQFSVVPDECPMETYYIEPDATTAQIMVDINEEVVKEDIQSVCLVNEESEIVETIDLQNVNISQKYWETRYNDIIELPYFTGIFDIPRNCSQVSVSTNLTRCLDEGNYTLVISTQEKTYEFSEILQVTTMPVLTDISLNQKYDSVGDYIYVNVIGKNLNPEKIRPVLYKENTQITEYVSSQKTSTGFLYKLQKLDKETCWKYYDSYLIEMKADEGYFFENQISKKRLNVTTDYFNLASLVMFDYYNYSKDVYEVIFGSTVEETGMIKVKLYDETLNNALVATATGVIDDNNKLELQFKDENGNDFIPTDAYRMEFYDSNNLFWFWQYSTYRAYNYGHPDLYSDLLIIEKSPMYQESGTTELPIECAILKSEVGTETEIVAEILDSYNNPIGENAILSLSTETEEDAEFYVRARGTWTNDTGLETGMYRVRFWAGNNAVNSSLLYIYDNEHFYQQYQLANWAGDNLKLTVRSEQFMGNYLHLYQDELDEDGNVQNAEQIWNDNFNVEIYDRLGNEMTEWEIEAVEYSGQNICLSIVNLPTNYAGFYVKVTHKEYGEGLLLTGGKCYSDYSGNSYGMYHSLQKCTLDFTLGGRNDAGVIGVRMGQVLNIR